MARAQEGDQDAYRLLMGELAGAIEAYVKSRFGRLNFLEDCVQECLLAVHSIRHTYDSARPFRPWLFTVVRHRTIDLLRSQDARARAFKNLSEQMNLDQREPLEPADVLGGDAVLQRLKPPYREALVLTKFAGYSISEAADRAGISENAMKSRVHRALHAAQQLLGREDANDGL
jgi:RNA polymerase sigma-70 factor (ECF subfamily)